MDIEEIATIAIDCGLKVHERLGPGLLETVYEKVLARALEARGLVVETQVSIPLEIDGMIIEQGFRADIIVEKQLLLEIKAVERLADVHHKQVLTYLRISRLSLGLLMNFSGSRFSDGLKRVVNRHSDVAGSQLRIHQ